jgi:chromosome partitioning protein
MILVFASSKGGAGKSTSCAAIGSALALDGERVLVLDLDPNGTVKRWSGKLAIHGLSVESVPPDQFSNVLRERRASRRYDHILVDLMGTREVTLLKALARADLVIIPAQTSEPDLREALVIASDVRDMAETKGKPIAYRLLLTKVYPLRTRVMDFVMAELGRLKLPSFHTALVERTAYREMFLSGEPPSRSDPLKAGREIEALLLEIRALTEPPRQRAVYEQPRPQGVPA